MLQGYSRTEIWKDGHLGHHNKFAMHFMIERMRATLLGIADVGKGVQAMTAWEYLVYTSTKMSDDSAMTLWLNAKGKEGWELVSVVATSQEVSGIPAASSTTFVVLSHSHEAA